MKNNEITELILFEPIKQGAQKLLILSGYSSPMMASWHINQINELGLKPIELFLILGMYEEGISETHHIGYKTLCENKDKSSKFKCSYIYKNYDVHSKIYIWLKDDKPFKAYCGSNNYTQTGFGMKQREYFVECNPIDAYKYICDLDNDTIFCNHSEVEHYVNIKSIISEYEDCVLKEKIPIKDMVSLSLLARTGETGTTSGLNWGQREGREHNQAYISVPSKIAKSGFFPLEKKHFTINTDDGKQMIMRVQQGGDKAITTPLNNSLIGEYFRNRLGLANGSYITKQDLLNYGRTDVTFYKMDEEEFYMDFSIKK